MDVTIRPYQKGDETQIIRLYQEIFKKPKSLRHWQWEFKENPLGITHITVAVDKNGRVVGHYAGVPVLLNYRGRTITVTQAVDVMVHPDYRRGLAKKVLFQRIVEEHKRQEQIKNISFTYGYPTEVPRRLGVKYLGYQILGGVPLWQRYITPFNLRGPTRLEKVNELGPEIDDFWNEVSGYYKVALVRNTQYLNWRYVHNPVCKYEIYQSRDKSSGKITGFMVLNQNKITDLITHPGDKETISRLLCLALRRAARHLKLTVKLWAPETSALAGEAERLGFEKKPSGYFNCVYLSGAGDSIKLDELKNNWHYSMGDTDFY